MHDAEGLKVELTPGRASGEHGQGLAEYALILSLVAITAIVALIFIGGAISGTMSRIGTSL